MYIKNLNKILEFPHLRKDEIKNLQTKLKDLQPVHFIQGTSCLSGTRKEVLQMIYTWKKNTSPQVFWLTGIAGTGKSTVAESVFRMLSEHHLLGGYFTCKRDYAALHNPLNVLPTICYHLGISNPQYGQLIARRFDENASFGMGLGHLQTQFEELFVWPIKHLVAHELFKSQCIVIDALNECGSEDDQLILLHLLFKLVQMCPLVKIFITSQNMLNVSQSFDAVSILRYELTPSNSWDDILLYFQTHLPSLLATPSKDNILNISSLMADCSKGLFIWAETAYMFLKASPDFQTAIKQLIHTENKGSPYANMHLHQLYDLVLAQVIPDAELQSYEYIMGFIILSKEPLPIATLSSLLYSTLSGNVVLNTVKALQPLLCTDSSGHLQIIHPSLAEYLLAAESTKYHINVDMIHSALFQQSMYTMVKQLRFNICHLETSYIKNSDIGDLHAKIQDFISPELQYACLYWSHHLISCESTNVQSDHLLKAVFVNVKTLMWIECLSLLNKVYHGIHSIKKLLQWLSVINPGQVLEFYEVYYFIYKFYIPIGTSTPHIYLSALSFAPSQSIISRRCSYILPVPLIEPSMINKQWQANGLLFPSYTSSVFPVKISPKNNLIYSGSSDGTIVIWDSYTGESVASISAHECGVTALLLTQDGDMMISGSDDATIRFWDANTYQAVYQPLYCHSSTITSFVVNINGSILCCGSRDRTISIWKTSDNPPLLLQILQCSYIIRSLAISTDDKYIICGTLSHVLQIWDLDSYEKVVDLEHKHKSITALAVSPTTNHIACGTVRGYVLIWNLETHHLVHTPLYLGPSGINDILFTQNGGYLIISTEDLGIMKEITCLSLSSDNKRIVSGSRGSTVEVWDINSKVCLKKQKYAHSVIL
ncbi:WD40 repeat-like protein, partial [Pluteus cervinus]